MHLETSKTVRAPEVCDIAVIGAGPAGCALACDLAQSSFTVRVFDKLEDRKPESRATGFQPRLFALFEALGILDHVRREAIELHGNHIYLDGQQIRTVSFYNPELKQYGISLDQFMLESILTREMRVRGLEIERGRELRGIEPNGGGYTLYFGENGEAERVHARVVVGCDGARSRVREAVGIGFSGKTFPGRSFISDCVLATDLERYYAHFFLDADSRLVLVPLPGKSRYKISGTIPRDFTGEITPEVVNQQVARHLKDGTRVLSCEHLREYKTHAKLADTFVKDSVVLAGDAAHLFPPRGGQGVNVALEDAHFLARVLTRAAGDPGSAAFEQYNLEQYNIERREEVSRRLRQVRASRARYSYDQLSSQPFDPDEENLRVQREEL